MVDGVLTIFLGKPVLPVGKSNGSLYSIWKASENMGSGLRRDTIFPILPVQLLWIYFVAGRSAITSNFRLMQKIFTQVVCSKW